MLPSKKYLSQEMFECKTMKMLKHDHVTSKLDYYNSLHYVLPNKDLLKKLQLNMKIAARLLKGLLPCKRITPTMKYWIPIKAQIHRVFIICEGYTLQKNLNLSSHSLQGVMFHNLF